MQRAVKELEAENKGVTVKEETVEKTGENHLNVVQECIIHHFNRKQKEIAAYEEFRNSKNRTSTSQVRATKAEAEDRDNRKNH